jgi:hypothetical protein
MVKIVSFPEFGCGGIICAILNDEDLEFYNMQHINGIKNESHSYLKNKNIDRFNDKIKDCFSKNINFWLGTHHHPNIFLENKFVNNIIYVKTTNKFSKVWLALRASLGLAKNTHEQYHLYRNLILDFYIDPFESWYIPDDWLKDISHEKIINLELYDFIADEYYRDNLLSNINPYYDKNKFNEWYLKNDLSEFMKYAIDTFDEFSEKIPDYLIDRHKSA